MGKGVRGGGVGCSWLAYLICELEDCLRVLDRRSVLRDGGSQLVDYHSIVQ